MAWLTAALVLALELGSGFGTARAELIESDADSMGVEIEVEVDGTPDAVVAHLSLTGEPELVLPLISRDDGVYGIATELKPANYLLVFEAVGDTPAQSEPVSLSDLGVDLTAVGVTATTTEDGYSAETTGWGWLALAFAAASLAALAFWVLGGRDRDEASGSDEAESDEAQSEEASSPEP